MKILTKDWFLLIFPISLFLSSCFITNERDSEIRLAGYRKNIKQAILKKRFLKVDHFNNLCGKEYEKNEDLIGYIDHYKWLMEEFDGDRDGMYLDAIIQVIEHWKFPASSLREKYEKMKWFHDKGEWEYSVRMNTQPVLVLKYYRKANKLLKELNKKGILNARLDNDAILELYIFPFFQSLRSNNLVEEATELLNYTDKHFLESVHPHNGFQFYTHYYSLTKFDKIKNGALRKKIAYKLASSPVDTLLQTLSISNFIEANFSKKNIDEQITQLKKTLSIYNTPNGNGMETNEWVGLNYLLLSHAYKIKATNSVNNIIASNTPKATSVQATNYLDSAFLQLVATKQLPNISSRLKSRILISIAEIKGIESQKWNALYKKSKEKKFNKRVLISLDSSLIHIQEAFNLLLEKEIQGAPWVNPAKEDLIPDNVLLEIFDTKANLLSAYPTAIGDIEIKNNQLECYELFFETEMLIRKNANDKKDKYRLQKNYRNLKEDAVTLAHELYQLPSPDSSKYQEIAFKFSERSRGLVLREIMKNLQETDFKDSMILPSISDVQQKLLQPNQVLINYFQTKEYLYVFKISEKSVKFIKLPIKKVELNQLVTSFIKSICAPNSNTQEGNFLESAHEISKAIIYPLQLSNKRRIIIIPDEKLSILPFGALLSQKHDEEVNFKTLPYLILKHPISYGHSVWQLSNLKMRCIEKKKRKTRKYAYFAPINNKEFKLTGFDEEGEEFKNLKNTIKKLNGAIYSINKETFIKHVSKYDFYHIFSHGIINHQNPEHSSIMMLPDDLQAKEIYNLPVNNNNPYIFLENCDAASGLFQSGEGKMSIEVAFFHIGALGVIAPLNEILPKPSHILMKHIYDTIERDDLALDIAVQKAKIEVLMKHHSNPNNWAWHIANGYF